MYLSAQDSKGTTLDAHYEQVKKVLGEDALDFEGQSEQPEVPGHTSYLWDLYLSLFVMCGSDANGSKSITPGLVLDYCKLMQIELSTWEIELLFFMDSVRKEANSENVKG